MVRKSQSLSDDEHPPDKHGLLVSYPSRGRVYHPDWETSCRDRRASLPTRKYTKSHPNIAIFLLNHTPHLTESYPLEPVYKVPPPSYHLPVSDPLSPSLLVTSTFVNGPVLFSRVSISLSSPFRQRVYTRFDGV